jgi:hypothetical protein
MINYDSPFWQKLAFKLSIWGGSLFVLLTFAAMLVFPGGTLTDPATKGYSFFENFFSELGFLTTESGATNYWAAPLFFVAMNLAGASLIIFSLAFRQFFLENTRLRWLSGMGMVAGVLSGVCFTGVAFTPADILLDPHVFFVTWAFRLFPLSACLYAAAIFAHPGYPRRYGWLFAGFMICLVAYILLMELGPSAGRTYAGQVIQSAGQKIIVYVSIIMIGVQSWGALKKEISKRACQKGAATTQSETASAR